MTLQYMDDPLTLRIKAADEENRARICPLPALAAEHRRIAELYRREAEAIECVPFRAVGDAMLSVVEGLK